MLQYYEFIHCFTIYAVHYPELFFDCASGIVGLGCESLWSWILSCLYQRVIPLFTITSLAVFLVNNMFLKNQLKTFKKINENQAIQEWTF